MEVVPDGPDVGALAAGTNLDETIFYCYRLAPSQVIVAGGESIRKLTHVGKLVLCGHLLEAEDGVTEVKFGFGTSVIILDNAVIVIGHGTLSREFVDTVGNGEFLSHCEGIHVNLGTVVLIGTTRKVAIVCRYFLVDGPNTGVGDPAEVGVDNQEGCILGIFRCGSGQVGDAVLLRDQLPISKLVVGIIAHSGGGSFYVGKERFFGVFDKAGHLIDIALSLYSNEFP